MPTATGNQEYPRAEITVPGAPAPKQPTLNRTTTVDGIRFDLTTENNEGFTAGKATLVRVVVTDAKGQPVRALEPLMGAYAHGVGFPADLSGVTHVHPMGEEPTKDTERGGPELSFHLLPEKPGFLKFYGQVQLGGKDVYAGFGLDVQPAGATTAWEELKPLPPSEPPPRRINSERPPAWPPCYLQRHYTCAQGASCLA